MTENLRDAAREAARAHRHSLRQSLQRRLEAARARGDERLIRLLEAEANYLRIS